MHICVLFQQSAPTPQLGVEECTTAHQNKTHIPFLPKEEGMMRQEVMMSPGASGKEPPAAGMR